MAYPSPDPLQDLITDGRAHIMPYNIDLSAVVLTIDLDLLCTRLRHVLHTAYLTWEPLLLLYPGTSNNITDAITQDVNNTVDFALWICYNRLRAVAERYSPHTYTTRMKPRAPCSNRMEFPDFISSLLQSIGPLRITDAARDVLIIYAPPANTMQNFGRANVHDPSEGQYARLMNNLRACGVQTSVIDKAPNYGAYWTTCSIEMTDNLFNVVGSVHPSHYTNDDIAKAAVLGRPDPDPTLNPFQPVNLTVDYLNDTALLNALAAVAPTNLPPGQTATSAGRPSGLLYDVNYYGIKPAVAAQAATPEQPRGCYILGRGTQSIFTCYLARHVTEYDVLAILRYRLTH